MKRFSLFISIVILLFACSKKHDDTPADPVVVVPSAPDTLSAGWTKVGSIPVTETATDIFFTNFSNGYVTTGTGIYKSTDAGVTWAKISSQSGCQNIGATGSNACFTNETSTVYSTHDNGQTIQSTSNAAPASQPSIQDCYYASDNVCYAASYLYIWKSINGGTTFDSVYNFNDGSSTKLFIFFTDQLNGWITRNYHVYKTSDGGLTWNINKAIASGTGTGSISFIDNNNGFIADGNIVYKTTDAGITWQPGNAVINESISDISFVSPFIGFCCAGTHVYKTTDAGISWTKVVSLGGKGIIEVHFLDEHHGWACGEYGYVLRFNL